MKIQLNSDAKLARLLDSTLGRRHEHRDEVPDPAMSKTEEPGQR